MSLAALQIQLTTFDNTFDRSYEDRANQTRGSFLNAFPLDALGHMTLDQYVIGRRQPTFCDYLEQRTRPWANILGATAFKFGIYYGVTKSDRRPRYRFVKRAGSSPKEAFDWLKSHLLDLVKAGSALDFEAIDKNSISQMVKAKVLSLYFPDQFLNVCSSEHLDALAAELGLDEGAWTSEKQHLLLQAKLQNSTTMNWSNPKFMTFLYNTYLRSADEQEHVRKDSLKKYPKIDIDEMLANQKRIGEKSEAFALQWEEERLRGLGFMNPNVEDRRDTPACGYDFLSNTNGAEIRHIEVKSAGRDWIGGGYRFFLSENQRKVSLEPESGSSYYFYLVFYGKDGEPMSLKPWRPLDLYEICTFGSNGFVLSFGDVATE